ncbi:MAG: SGNH/GDSL hydrolase family protein, partial [Planctomycetales bacterium]|nr:SGNH/GDSL hydrolase family protein [Planctomycetales bacterium]
REQRYGYLEAALTTVFPAAKVVQRNLGWSGDTVWGEARARFGAAKDGFEHLETHVFAEAPSLIFVAYGGNESFAGENGLDSFIAGYERLLDVLASTGAELILLTPTPCEAAGPALRDPATQNANLRLYSDAIRQLAEQRQYRVVDLFSQLEPTAHELGYTGPLTDNGMHLTSLGYWLAAQTVLKELGLQPTSCQCELDAEGMQARAVGCRVAQLAGNAAHLQWRMSDVSPAIPPPNVQLPSTQSIRITHLPPGNYQLRLNGHPAITATADDWSDGISLPTWTSVQANSLLTEMRHKNQLYFHRWRPQNETYLFLFRKHEQGNNAVEIPQFDPLIDQVEAAINPLAQPTSIEAE